ncbi:MAG: hypothetical protein M1140_02190 [Chloroflexi bacterium]|nr:hypothetical protein [Chloroflexota bacterium]
MEQTIRQKEYSTRPTLYLAFELSNQDWKLGFTVGLGQPTRQRKIAAGDTTGASAGKSNRCLASVISRLSAVRSGRWPG